ncbi:MarR family winged helix-turn-helix transcriptional regulator [Rhodococcus wratislaviensis]|uniref:Putative MarR family transcriptional regulator n=1 Tax=Rhodococcus wratislaviensis NBRC 100605 TaxID=1219028 RepID=X0QYB9_RHOWR|nr:MarR family transcriptional regulator [Rhodococcus wratislaviensis]GAF43605.1 putative MarR family transcriptional regulator [Rhodococcus wratislaviensis NBRC 100605]
MPTEPKAAPVDAIAETARQWLRNEWANPLAMYTVTSMIRSDQIVQSMMEQTLSKFDLTVARYEVLVILRFSKLGEMPLARISERLQVHPTSLTTVVDRLADHGFIERKPHPSDRRATLAVMTALGREAVEKAQLAVADEVFASTGLNAREQRQLVSLLNKVRMAAGDSIDQSILPLIWRASDTE